MKELAIRRPEGAIALPDSAQWINRFEVKSRSSNRLYVISQNRKSQKWACSCLGWISHKKCTHLIDGCGLDESQIHGRDQITDTKRKRLN